MSQFNTPICRDFIKLDKESKRKLMPYIISLYVQDCLANGDYMKAWSAVVNAIDKGYENKYLRELKDYIGVLYTLSNYIDQAKNVFTNLDKIPSSYISYLLNKIKTYYNKVKSILPEAVKNSVEKTISLLNDAKEVSRFYEDSTRAITEAYNVLNTFIDYISRSENNIDMLENAFGYGKNALPRIINTFDNLLMKDIDVRNPEMALLRNRIKDMLENVKYIAKGFYILSYHGLPIIGDLQALINDLKSYGGNNVLANPYYRSSVRDKIRDILQNVSALRINSTYYRYPEEARSMMKELAGIAVNILNNLKKELGSKDGRFVDVFEEAESSAGVNLIDVPKPVSAIPGLEEFVRDVAEKNELAFRSDPLWLKIIGAIGIIGAGALDNLTIILRPSALVEQFEAIKTMLGNTAENVKKEGLVGLGESAQALFESMFGTPERALYTIGGILSAIALTKAIEKIPLPTKWRAVLVDLLQGDPVGLMISGAGALGIKSILRKAIIKPKDGKVLVDTLPKGFDETIESTLKESIGEATAKHVVALSDELSKKLAKMIRKGADFTEIKNSIADAVKKYGLENLMEDYHRLMDTKMKLVNVLKTYVEAEAKRVDDLVRKVGSIEMRDLLEQAPALKVLRQFNEARETLLPNLKSFIHKYKDLLGEEDYKKMYRYINEIEDAINTGDLGKALSLVQALNLYVLGEIDPTTLRKEMSSVLKELGMEKLSEKVEKAFTVADLANVIAEIDKALLKKFDPKFLEAYNKLWDVLIKLEKTRLGKLFRALGNRFMQKIIMKIDEILEPEYTRKLTLPEVVNAVNNLFTMLERFGDVPPELRKKLIEKAVQTIRNTPAPMLSKIFRSIADKIDAKKLPPDLRRTLNRLLNEAKRGTLTLSDIEEFTEKLAKSDAVKAGLIEYNVISKLLNEITQYIEKLEKNAPAELRVVLTDVRNKLGEIVLRKIFTETGKEALLYSKVMALNPIPINLEYTLKTLVDYVKEVNPSYAGKLKDIVDRFIKEAGEGKISEQTLLALFKELRNIRKIKGIKIGLLDRLRKSMKDFVEWLEIKRGHKPGAIRALRNLADIISRDIDAVKKEMEKGWGFISYEVGRAKVTVPFLADPETVRKFYELMDNPVIEKHIRIGNIDIIGRRKVELRSDGTFRIEYELMFPKNRKIRILQVTRPVRSLKQRLKGLVPQIPGKLDVDIDVYHRVSFDPEPRAILDLVQKNPTLYRELVTGDIFRKIDPMFDVLDNVIVYKLDMPFTSIFSDALKAIPYLASIATSAPRTELLKMFTQKAQDVEAITEILTSRFTRLIRKPEIPGMDVITAVQLPDNKKLVIGIPYTPDIMEKIIGWAKIRFRDKVIIVPKIKVGENVYYILPPIQLEYEKAMEAQKLREKQVETPKEEFKPEETPAPPSSVPITGTPIPSAVGGFIPAISFFTRGSYSGGRKQYEEIYL